jgi:hypothetical protein
VTLVLVQRSGSHITISNNAIVTARIITQSDNPAADGIPDIWGIRDWAITMKGIYSEEPVKIGRPAKKGKLPA